MRTGTPEGLLNFRDVGGLPAAEGRVVHRGLLYRSDSLQFLSPEAARSLVDELGIRTVIDLRLPYETRREGRGPLAELPHHYHHLPFLVAGAEQEGSAVPRYQDDDPITRHYLGYLSTSPEAVAGVVRALVDEPAETALPAVVHCTAGKDRTGVAVAVVLAVLGVPPDHIAAEYAAGSAAMPAVFERLRTMVTYGARVDDMPAASRRSDAGDMRRFLDAVDELYGGAVGYLRRHGVTDAELDALRARLTEPAPDPLR